MCWINLAQDKDNWSNIVNKLKEFCLAYNVACFLRNKELFASHGLSYRELGSWLAVYLACLLVGWSVS